MTPENSILILQKISKRFGNTRVLEDLSWNFSHRKNYAIVGDNGAGKSTLLKIAAGLIMADSGGRQIGPGISVGYSDSRSLLYGALSIEENLRFFGALVGDTALDATLEQWDLASIKFARVDTLSQGQIARVGIARAFLGNPPLVILDEPTSFLDTKTVNMLVEKIRARKVGAVITATHDTNFIDAIQSEILILKDRKIIASSPGFPPSSEYID